MNAPDQSFGKERRIRRKPEIDAVFAASNRVSLSGLTLRYRFQEQGVSRIAIITGKRWGNSVERNRLRRVSREVFRKWQCPQSFSVDAVISQYKTLRDVPGIRIAGIIKDLLGMIRKQT